MIRQFWVAFKLWRVKRREKEAAWQRWHEYTTNRLDWRFQEFLGWTGIIALAVGIMAYNGVGVESSVALLYYLIPAVLWFVPAVREVRVLKKAQEDLESVGLRESEPWNGKGNPPIERETVGGANHD